MSASAGTRKGQRASPRKLHDGGEDADPGHEDATEGLGDEAAAQMALRLAEMMQEVADRHHGLVVKMLGDGVHFHFQSPVNAVLASLDFVALAESYDLSPAHVGVDAGPMTYTDGDYYGFTVIIAARLAAHADPSEVLVGEGARAAAEVEGEEFENVGPVELEGVAEPVVVYRAARTTAAGKRVTPAANRPGT